MDVSAWCRDDYSYFVIGMIACAARVAVLPVSLSLLNSSLNPQNPKTIVQRAIAPPEYHSGHQPLHPPKAIRLSLGLSLLPLPPTLLSFFFNPQLLDGTLLALHQPLTRTNIKRLSVIL